MDQFDPSIDRFEKMELWRAIWHAEGSNATNAYIIFHYFNKLKWIQTYFKIECCCFAKHISKSKWRKTCSAHFWKLSRPKLEAIVAQSTFPKTYKTPQVQATFRSWDVEKVNAMMARSTCPSQNAPHVLIPLECPGVEKGHRIVARGRIGSELFQKLMISSLFWSVRCC